jgi:hypothetical protein
MTENEDITLYNIASVKAYNYCQEYNPITGQVQDKDGYRFLKEGYIAGFMAGFAHRLTGGSNED